MQTSGELLAAAPGKSARTRRRWPWVTDIVVFVVLYAGLVAAYAISGANVVVDQPAKEIPAGGVGVILTARNIDAAIPEMDMDVQLDLDDSLLDDAGAPLQPITLTLGPTRNFFPGSPPPGSWVDVLLVLGHPKAVVLDAAADGARTRLPRW